MPFTFHPFRNRTGQGRQSDRASRLPRYLLLFGVSSAALWTPIIGYLRFAPEVYVSEVSLILPGSGAQASVNLTDLGQASSSASSAFSSTRVSPTQTYKRLLAANRTQQRAAQELGIARDDLGSPRIELVDETSLIHFSMSGASPEAAQIRAQAILSGFLEELDALRQDEMAHRDRAARVAIAEYEKDVHDVRSQIAAVQQTSGLLSFDHYTALVTERDALAGKVAEARSNQIVADAYMASLSEKLGIDPATASLNLRLLADPEIQELAQALAEQHAALAGAKGRFGARHPAVTSASHAVAGTKAELAARGSFVGGEVVQLAAAKLDFAPGAARVALLSELVERFTDCQSKAANLVEMTAQLAQLDARLAALAPQAARLDDLSRDYQVAEAVFASALARTDTSKAEVYASYPLVQVLADASLADHPSSPRDKIAIAAGVAATLMVLGALALAWLRRPLIAMILHKDET